MRFPFCFSFEGFERRALDNKRFMGKLSARRAFGAEKRVGDELTKFSPLK